MEGNDAYTLNRVDNDSINAIDAIDLFERFNKEAIKNQAIKSYIETIENLAFEAIGKINEIRSTEMPANPVIVFDLDDTLIMTDDTPITPMIRVFNYAKECGISPVIITARSATPKVIQYTHEDLSIHDIYGHKWLFFIPPEMNNPFLFKLSSRKRLHDMGYNVIMSIGDTHWDIGDYGGHGILLPRLDQSVLR